MTTRAEEIAAEGPYRADHENGFSVVRDLSAPEGSKIMMMMPEPMKWFADRMNEAHANGYKQGQQDKWISVEERLPEPGQRVLCHSDVGSDRIIAYLSIASGFPSEVTHWMPLPPLPPNPEQP